MKRFLQLVALFVVVLLAAQPALAGLPCDLGSSVGGGCAPGCSMAMSQTPMSQMSPGCSMSQQSIGNGCEQSCCQAAVPQDVARLATPAKAKAAGATHFIAASQILADAGAAFRATPPVAPAAAAPARYILFQVFRI